MLSAQQDGQRNNKGCLAFSKRLFPHVEKSTYCAKSKPEWFCSELATTLLPDLLGLWLFKEKQCRLVRPNHRLISFSVEPKSYVLFSDRLILIALRGLAAPSDLHNNFH